MVEIQWRCHIYPFYKIYPSNTQEVLFCVFVSVCVCVSVREKKCCLSQVWLNGHEAHNHTWQAAFQKVCIRHTFLSGSRCQKALNFPTANKLCFVFFVWNSKDSSYTLSTPTRQQHGDAFTETFCKQSSPIPINPGWKERIALQGFKGDLFLIKKKVFTHLNTPGVKIFKCRLQQLQR